MVFLKKRYFWLVLLIFSFTMTGCYSIHVDQRISHDGSGSVEITYDLSEMGQMADMMGNMPNDFDDVDDDFDDDVGIDLDELCEDFYEQGSLLVNSECVVLGEYIMVISGDIPVGSVEILDDGDKYGIMLKDIYKFMGPISEDGFEEMDDEEILLSEEMDVTMTLTVFFDGDVVESEVGDFDGNQLNINFYDLARAENPVAWAQKEGASQVTSPTNGDTPIGGEGDTALEGERNNMLIIILSALIFLGVVAFIILKAKKGAKGQTKKPEDQKSEKSFDSQNQQAREQTSKSEAPTEEFGSFNQEKQGIKEEVNLKIQSIIDWIKKYEGDHSEEVLRKNLEKNPKITQQEIDIAFRNK